VFFKIPFCVFPYIFWNRNATLTWLGHFYQFLIVTVTVIYDFLHVTVTVQTRRSSELKKRLGALPGNAKKYLSALTKCLEFVEERNPSEAEFQKWFLREFLPVKSKQLVKDYIRTIENLGLIARTRDNFTLSDKAKKFLRARDKKILYEILDNTYVAVYDILELLREKPSTLKEIESFLEKKTGVKWQTRTQYSLRLSWLLGLGYVTKSGRHYSLTEEGRDIIENENEIIEKPQTHREIQDRIAETGKFLGYLSETEYKVGRHILDIIWKEIEEGDPTFVFEVVLSRPKLSDALVRLKYARRRFGGSELYLVTKQKHMATAKDIIRTSFREIAEVINIIDWESIDQLRETGVKFFETAKKMNLTPKVILRAQEKVADPGLL
jgi:predicted transcriptional regulator